MNELLRRRKRLTELEVQCYMNQILNSLKYLHSNRIIHRDLKLGNLFLSDKMEIKIGDFGLATKLEFEGERKRTICGTPNYIAPEILEGKNGHSYEVDIWSLGVIMYTLLIGKPPFETTDVKTTYRKIRMNAYCFPEQILISNAAKTLIQKILNTDPAMRPTIDEIFASEFFNSGATIPKLLPISTLACPPSSSYTRQFLPPNQRDLSAGRASPQRLESTAPVNSLNRMLLKERKDFVNTDKINLNSDSNTGNGNGNVIGLVRPNSMNNLNHGLVTKVESGKVNADNPGSSRGLLNTKEDLIVSNANGYVNMGSNVNLFDKNALSSNKTSTNN